MSQRLPPSERTSAAPVSSAESDEQLGEDRVDPAPAEGRAGELGHLARNRVDAAEQRAQLVHEAVLRVRWIAHGAPPSKAGSSSMPARSFARQRIRVGPIDPIGIPSAALIVS